MKPEYVPKTHGYIVPWDPPQFGIPDQVLEELARQLEQEVVALAQAGAKEDEDASQQSSPQNNPSPATAIPLTLKTFDISIYDNFQF